MYLILWAILIYIKWTDYIRVLAQFFYICCMFSAINLLRHSPRVCDRFSNTQDKPLRSSLAPIQSRTNSLYPIEIWVLLLPLKRVYNFVVHLYRSLFCKPKKDNCNDGLCMWEMGLIQVQASFLMVCLYYMNALYAEMPLCRVALVLLGFS